jgi:hypothetical protein
VLIAWTTLCGKTNVVQATNGGRGGSCSNNFTDVSPQITVSGSDPMTTNYLDRGGATNRCRWYRVRLLR